MEGFETTRSSYHNHFARSGCTCFFSIIHQNEDAVVRFLLWSNRVSEAVDLSLPSIMHACTRNNRVAAGARQLWS
jgi:hypothetical protein